MNDDTDTAPEDAALEGGERIAKRLARAGLCSRRDAERWIADGRVAVNGATLTSPALVVREGDIVLVDGKPIPEAEQTRLWRYYKPSGLVTTARDEKGRATVFDKLPEDMPRVVSIGRLDLTTEGLLLLTNDGELARFIELPATGWTRRYRVRVHGTVDEAKLTALSKGITVEGVKYGPIEAVLERVQGSNAWLMVGIKEGKNREIRKVMEALNLTVNRLIRIAYGPFQLGKLEEGKVEEVPKRVLKDQLARFFGVKGGSDKDGGGGEAPATKEKPAAAKKPVARAKPIAKARPIAKDGDVVKDRPAAKGKPIGIDRRTTKEKPVAKDRPAATDKPMPKGKLTVKDRPEAKGKPPVKDRPRADRRR